MFEQRPTFLARKNPGTGWGIDILWADGETEVIKGFITEHDAVKWIAEYSKALRMTSHPKRPSDSEPSWSGRAVPRSYQRGQYWTKVLGVI